MIHLKFNELWINFFCINDGYYVMLLSIDYNTNASDLSNRM